MSITQAPADVEQYYACKTHKMTGQEYQALLAMGFRFKAHGLFNRNSWHKKVPVHKGTAWSPTSWDVVERELKDIRRDNNVQAD